MENCLFISVIIPAHNAGRWIERSAGTVARSTYPAFEVIVVDDGSTDNTGETCEHLPVSLIRLPNCCGPAAARNEGARNAQGDILFFIDSDVVALPDVLNRVAANFKANPLLAAVFGSYDAAPPEPNFLSQYKNIFHHFVHQTSKPEANTFWAGCGAVRRAAFEAVGGFDSRSYALPSIEDIELGYRLRRGGFKILLDKDLQCTHLKEWRLISLLRADIFCRAIPWSRLILRTGESVNDLNLKLQDRIAAATSALLLLTLLFSVFKPSLLYAAPALAGTIILLNRSFYKFLVDKRGMVFAVRAFVIHVFYYCYSAIAFAFCWCEYALHRWLR